MGKKIIKGNIGRAIAKIRLTLLASKAGPSPLLGQAFGQYGINIMEFCNIFNKKTQNIDNTVLIPTTVVISQNMANRSSFEVFIKTPSTTALLKKTAFFKKGCNSPKKQNFESFHI